MSKKHVMLEIGYLFSAEIQMNDRGIEYKVLSVIHVGQNSVIYEIKNMDTRIIYVGKVL